MYFIDISIKADRVPADKADDLLAAHRTWFKAQADAGHFLLVGPYRDKPMAGLVVAYANSRVGCHHCSGCLLSRLSDLRRS